MKKNNRGSDRKSGEPVDQVARVALIMGSDSDWKVMAPAYELLEEFGVRVEAKVVSAHRTPEEMFEFARSARASGFSCIIAGAGGAAHLPGMVASLTELPVIGVPVPVGPLQGQDALYSIVQMPSGVPVACVGIGNARNAALLAIQILGVRHEGLQRAMREYKQAMHKKVLAMTVGMGAS